MRLSLELIGVRLVVDGRSIRILCVVFNFQLTITIRRHAFVSRSSRDTERPWNSLGSGVLEGQQHPTVFRRIGRALQRAWISAWARSLRASKGPSGDGSPSLTDSGGGVGAL